MSALWLLQASATPLRHQFPEVFRQEKLARRSIPDVELIKHSAKHHLSHVSAGAAVLLLVSLPPLPPFVLASLSRLHRLRGRRRPGRGLPGRGRRHRVSSPPLPGRSSHLSRSVQRSARTAVRAGGSGSPEPAGAPRQQRVSHRHTVFMAHMWSEVPQGARESQFRTP